MIEDVADSIIIDGYFAQVDKKLREQYCNPPPDSGTYPLIPPVPKGAKAYPMSHEERDKLYQQARAFVDERRRVGLPILKAALQNTFQSRKTPKKVSPEISLERLRQLKALRGQQ